MKFFECLSCRQRVLAVTTNSMEVDLFLIPLPFTFNGRGTQGFDATTVQWSSSVPVAMQ